MSEVFKLCESCAHSGSPKFSGYCKACCFGSKFVQKGEEIIPEIEKVIFNKPATIIFWKDGTKTVVKVQGKEKFNKEKGLAMAVAKKALGNKGNYYEEFKKWL